MTEEKILQIIKAYFHEQFEIPMEKIVPEARLFEDLNLDSIDALDMVGMLESELDIDVDEKDLTTIQTIQDVLEFVKRKVENK